MEIENLNGLITLIYGKKRQLATGTFNSIIKKGKLVAFWTSSFGYDNFLIFTALLCLKFFVNTECFEIDKCSSVRHRSHPVLHFFRLPTRALRYSSLQPLKSYKIISIVYKSNKQQGKKRSNAVLLNI